MLRLWDAWKWGQIEEKGWVRGKFGRQVVCREVGEQFLGGVEVTYGGRSTVVLSIGGYVGGLPYKNTGK